MFETKDNNIINEFLFSFLITKFYIYNEQIYYIPKDITVYIEIQNGFEDYSSKLSILNLFNKENITIDNMPKFNYSKIGIDSNEKLEQFVKKYIGNQNYSFHQINIFIKLFISQFSKKIEENIRNKGIEEFAKSTKYFIYTKRYLYLY